jgi:hypothetical protein
MYAALIRAAERWRGIKVGEFEQRQLSAIRDEIDKDFTARNAPVSGRNGDRTSTNLSSKTGLDRTSSTRRLTLFSTCAPGGCCKSSTIQFSNGRKCPEGRTRTSVSGK